MSTFFEFIRNKKNISSYSKMCDDPLIDKVWERTIIFNLGCQIFGQQYEEKAKLNDNYIYQCII